jgi:hypothetical protein
MTPTVYIVVAADNKTAAMKCRDVRYRGKGVVTGEATRENLVYDMLQVYAGKKLPKPRMAVWYVIGGGLGKEEALAG